MKHKIVYNACYGGFGLSPLATKMYYEKKHPEIKLYFYIKEDYSEHIGTFRKIDDSKLKEYKEKDFSITILVEDFGETFRANEWERCSEMDNKFHDAHLYNSNIEESLKRHDPVLVEIVETLGDDASGSCARLRVKEIEGTVYRIDEYDGYESVIEGYSDWISVND